MLQFQMQDAEFKKINHSSKGNYNINWKDRGCVMPPRNQLNHKQAVAVYDSLNNCSFFLNLRKLLYGKEM